MNLYPYDQGRTTYAIQYHSVGDLSADQEIMIAIPHIGEHRFRPLGVNRVVPQEKYDAAVLVAVFNDRSMAALTNLLQRLEEWSEFMGGLTLTTSPKDDGLLEAYKEYKHELR